MEGQIIRTGWTLVVPGEKGCLSDVLGMRCLNLDRGESIGLYIPVLLSVVYLPILLKRAWSRPQASLLFLALEIVTGVAVSTWDLVVHIDPPRAVTYQIGDIALDITLGLPLLFLLLIATSIYLSLLRPSLPEWHRSTATTTALLVLVLPLVPVGIICSLLSSVLLLVYRVNSLLDTVEIGFPSERELSVHRSLTTASAVIGYILLITFFTYFTLFHPPSLRRFTATSRCPQPTLTLSLLSTGLLLTAMATTLTSVPATLAALIVRKCLHTFGRGCLVFGFIIAYPIDAASQTFSILDISTYEYHKRGRSTQPRAKVSQLSSLKVGAPVEDTFGGLTPKGMHDSHASSLVTPHAHGVFAPERAILRAPAARAPVLSFPSSLFATSRDALGAARSPAYLSNSAMIPYSLGENRAQNVESIHDPAKEIVDLDAVANWPLPPPRVSLPPSPSPRGRCTELERSDGSFRSSQRDPATGLPSPRIGLSADIPALWNGLGEGVNLKQTARRIRQDATLFHIHSADTGTMLELDKPSAPSAPSGSPLQHRVSHVSHKSHRGELAISTYPPPPDPASLTIQRPPLVATSSSHKQVRRETDPSMAMDPQRRRSHTYPPPAYPVNTAPSTPDSLSLHTDRSRSLFFSTPLQSPTSSNSFPSPRQGSPPPSLRSVRNSHLSIVLNHPSDRWRPNLNANDAGRTLSGVRSVMASLFRVTRDAGIDLDPGRLGLTASQMETVRDSLRSEYSLEEMQMEGHGDTTPFASVGNLGLLPETKRYRGGVI